MLVLDLENVVELFEHMRYLSKRCSFDIFARVIKKIKIVLVLDLRNAVKLYEHILYSVLDLGNVLKIFEHIFYS